jgi:hypothetical protein
MKQKIDISKEKVSYGSLKKPAQTSHTLEKIFFSIQNGKFKEKTDIVRAIIDPRGKGKEEYDKAKSKLPVIIPSGVLKTNSKLSPAILSGTICYDVELQHNKKTC